MGCVRRRCDESEDNWGSSWYLTLFKLTQLNIEHSLIIQNGFYSFFQILN